jgi:outer membrane protein assembly factor BamB
MQRILNQRIAACSVLVVGGAIGLSASNWPSFRGEQARGVASRPIVTSWNAVRGSNIRWQVPVSGLSHASPIVWGGRVYVLSARGEASTLDRTAQGVVFAADRVPHEWRLHCLDARDGGTIWSRVVHSAVPMQARHVRGTYANATPATNGRVIVASLANEGLFAFDMEGRALWRIEMRPPAADHSLDPASSPVIAGDVVIVQNDWRSGSFAAAYELSTGREKWRIARSEGLAWL